jgi:hypothetical protein
LIVGRVEIKHGGRAHGGLRQVRFGITHSEVKINLNADLNPMLAMMAKRPLQNLVNIMADKLKDQF